MEMNTEFLEQHHVCWWPVQSSTLWSDADVMPEQFQEGGLKLWREVIPAEGVGATEGEASLGDSDENQHLQWQEL